MMTGNLSRNRESIVNGRLADVKSLDPDGCRVTSG
jgi:hypothetical protein